MKINSNNNKLNNSNNNKAINYNSYNNSLLHIKN